VKKKHKLGVIVPFRDRWEHLEGFLLKVPEYLRKQDIDFEIIIAEQIGEGEFNRGALLNAGALEAIQRNCDYLAFHDIDLLPKDVDYSYPEYPVELVNKLVTKDGLPTGTPINYDYFGGVTLFSVKDFLKTNGYSNRYMGWGFEDNDLLERCKEVQLPLGTKTYRQTSILDAAFTFNGKDSYVEFDLPTKLDPNKELTLLVTFRVDRLSFGETEISDEGCILSIPGYDLNISYTNFGTYKFEVFDNYGQSYSIHTPRMPLGITSQAAIVFKYKKMTAYLNGIKIGTKNCEEGKDFYVETDKLHLGVADPTRGTKSKWLDGQVSDVAIFNKALTQLEIANIFSEAYLGLGPYKPLYWFKASTAGQDMIPNLGIALKKSIFSIGKYDIEPIVTLQDTFQAQVPNRRTGTFVEQEHNTNGSVNGSWQKWSTRQNQHRFGLAETRGTFKRYDGLSTLNQIASMSCMDRDRYTKVQVRFTQDLLKKNRIGI